MIFNHIRTKRLNVTLRELTLAEAISLCKLPAERLEATTTEMLKFVAADASIPTPRYVKDPRMMTVQERTYLVAQYISQVSDDGPDFAIGRDGARYSHFVQFDKDVPAEETALGKVNGRDRVLRHLLGVHVQAMEVICKSRGDWIVGAIACQMSDAGVPALDWEAMSLNDVMAFLDDQMGKIKALPESAFEQVFAAYWAGTESLSHFFNLDFDASGLVYMPHTEQEAGLNPARFLPDSAISDITRVIAQ